MKYIICSDGKKRQAKEYTCQQCENNFLSRKPYGGRKPPKYCSDKCRKEAKKANIITLQCDCCGVKFSRNKKLLSRSKSGFYFCTRECKDKSQKLGGIREIMPSHYGDSHKKDYWSTFDKEELVCKRCGYNEFESSVEIHHIDKNRNNNSKENLIPLCRNCHGALHLNYWTLSDIMRGV